MPENDIVHNTIENANAIDKGRFINDNSLDIIFCDPPSFRNSNDKNLNNWTSENDYFKWMRIFFNICSMKLKKTGIFYLIGDTEVISPLIQIIEEFGFSLQTSYYFIKDRKFKSGKKLKEMTKTVKVVDTIFVFTRDIQKKVKKLLKLKQQEYQKSAREINFSISGNSNGGGYLWAGETINVTVTLKNTGQSIADDYQLYCPIPYQATYVSQSGTAEGIRWDDDLRGLIWDLNGLEVGESRDISFKMTVDNGYYYESSTVSSEFYIVSGGEEFPVEPASIYIQGHPYLNVVAMGDSLIAKSDWVQRLDNKLEAAYPAADYNTTASAISGEMSFEGLARYDSTVGPLRPTILIVAYGSNDVGASQSYFSYCIDNIIAKGKGQGATVFINTIGPISNPGKSEWPIYNNIIRQVASKHGIPVIDVTTPLSQSGGYLYDGLHYSPAGAELVAQTVFNSIVPYLNGLGGRR